MQPLCFSIMPFEDDFDEVNEIIRQAAEANGMTYLRSDMRRKSGSVKAQILRDIDQARVIVVDITGHNPNVFYELGIAHQAKPAEHVILITRSKEGAPYDVMDLRHFVYKRDQQGRQNLQETLTDAICEALKAHPTREYWNVIRGRTERTATIVRDLKRLLGILQDDGTDNYDSLADLSGVTIRCAAGLTSLAISDHEPSDRSEGSNYDSLLRQERDLLRQALAQGARFKVLLNPPRRFAKKMFPDRLRARYRRLIKLLRGESDFEDKENIHLDQKIMARCNFAMNPVPIPNLFMIDHPQHLITYEGIKRGGTRGFERTHFETDPEVVHQMIKEFDEHFDDCALQHAGESLVETLQVFLDQAESDIK